MLGREAAHLRLPNPQTKVKPKVYFAFPLRPTTSHSVPDTLYAHEYPLDDPSDPASAEETSLRLAEFVRQLDNLN
jgi:hypothetical protein